MSSRIAPELDGDSETALALEDLAALLPRCDALNLGYALLVKGVLAPARLEGAVRALLSSDPLLSPALNAAEVWQSGPADRGDLAWLAAAHLCVPLEPASPLRAALWSCDARTHLFLLSVHHQVADGVTLDRIGRDLSSGLQGRAIEPVPRAKHRPAPEPIERAARGLPLPIVGPSARCGHRDLRLPLQLSERFFAVARSWRSTPFAALVACVSAVLAAWSEAEELNLSVQVSGRSSTAAQRAAGAWYDHLVLDLEVGRGEPLLALLDQANRKVLEGLGSRPVWAGRRVDGPRPEVLVVFDRHPLASFRAPGCRVRPLGVLRQPLRPDGSREHLVATDADIVVFAREQLGTVGLSIFYKLARVPDATAQWLLDAVVEAAEALCDEGERPLELTELPCGSSAVMDACAGAPAWVEPTFTRRPWVDAVSPVFRHRPETLHAIAADAHGTLAIWGKPPWASSR